MITLEAKSLSLRERVPAGRVRAGMTKHFVAGALTRRVAPPSPKGRGTRSQVFRVEQQPRQAVGIFRTRMSRASCERIFRSSAAHRGQANDPRPSAAVAATRLRQGV